MARVDARDTEDDQVGRREPDPMPMRAESPGLPAWSEMGDDERRAWIHGTLARLSTSAFRARFSLSAKDRAYALDRGEATIRDHARDLLAKRVGPAEPDRDGKQTPFRGHPAFTAQHATATCCRGCIQKWHHIPKGRPLTEDELDRLCALVIAWIRRDLVRHR